MRCPKSFNIEITDLAEPPVLGVVDAKPVLCKPRRTTFTFRSSGQRRMMRRQPAEEGLQGPRFQGL